MGCKGLSPGLHTLNACIPLKHIPCPTKRLPGGQRVDYSEKVSLLYLHIYKTEITVIVRRYTGETSKVFISVPTAKHFNISCLVCNVKKLKESLTKTEANECKAKTEEFLLFSFFF